MEDCVFLIDAFDNELELVNNLRDDFDLISMGSLISNILIDYVALYVYMGGDLDTLKRILKVKQLYQEK